MKHISTRATRTAVVSASVFGLVAGASMASAQVPGGGTEGIPVKVDDTSLIVTVADKGEAPTEVTGTIANTTDAVFRCEVPPMPVDGGMSPRGYGQVTTAEAADEVMAFYANNIFTGPNVINPGDNLVSMGSMVDLLPAGSAMGSADGDTRTAHYAARVAGRTGDPRVGGQLQFTVPAGETVDYSAALGRPATGDRGQWQAAAVFMCQNQTTQNWFVYAGYEDVPGGADGDGTRSGSLDAGSLGSSGDNGSSVGS